MITNYHIIGGEQANYTWTLPTAKTEPCIAEGTCNCVIRVRYNVSFKQY